MSHSYEIEIKSLLGSYESAENLIEKMKEMYVNIQELKGSSQLNHYFVGGDKEKLEYAITALLKNNEEKDRLKKTLRDATALSIRTRKADNDVLFVLKASIDDTTSENGTARVEFEVKVEKTLDELDEILLECGCEVQAKWSRERKEYDLGEGTLVCIDRNAGYGYIAEFERVVEDATEADAIKQELRTLMENLGVEELSQERLERMFAYYNQHWRDYYGTDKTFIIE